MNWTPEWERLDQSGVKIFLYGRRRLQNVAVPFNKTILGLSPVVTHPYSMHTTHSWYCTGIMRASICHTPSPCCTVAADTFRRQLSTCAWLQAVLPSPLCSCLLHWKDITVVHHHNNNNNNAAVSPGSIRPCETANRGLLRGPSKNAFHWCHLWFYVKRTRQKGKRSPPPSAPRTASLFIIISLQLTGDHLYFLSRAEEELMYHPTTCMWFPLQYVEVFNVLHKRRWNIRPY